MGSKGKTWRERSQRELQEREWGWAKELEKKKREWEREQKWEARSKNGVPNGGPKTPNNLGNTLGKGDIIIKTRILNGIIEWDAPAQEVDSLPKEVEVVT